MSFFSDLSVSSQVQALYVAYYGRPADPAGLVFWTNEINKSGVDRVINAFGTSPEAVGRFSGLTDRQKVLEVYRAVLGREGDDAGVDFYTTGLGNGSFTLASLALNVVDGVVSRDDVVALSFRLQAANDFTSAINTAEELQSYSGQIGVSVGTAFLKPINNLETFNAADADAAIAALQPGVTRTLNTDDDIIINTTGRADTFTAAAGTLGADDVIVDKFTGDADVLNATLAGPIGPGTPRIEGIERINLTWDAFGTAFYDASKTLGATITGTSTKLGFLGDFTVINAGSNNVVAGAGMKGALVVSGASNNVVTATAASSVNVMGTGSTSATVVAGVTTSLIEVSNFSDATVDATLAAKDATITAFSAQGNSARLAVQIADDASLSAFGYGNNSVVTTTVANGKVLTLEPLDSTGANFVVAGPGSATVKLNVADLRFSNGFELSKATAGQLNAEVVGNTAVNQNFVSIENLAFDNTKFLGALGGVGSPTVLTVRDGQRVELAANNNNVSLSQSGQVGGATIALSNSAVGSIAASIGGVINLIANAPTAAGEAKNVDLTLTNVLGNNLTLSGSNDVVIQEINALSLNASALTGSLKLTSTTFVNTVVGSRGDNEISMATSAGQRSVTTQGGNDVVKATLGQSATVVVEAGDGADRVELAGNASEGSNIVLDFGSGADTLAYGGNLIDGNIVIRGLEALEVTTADATIVGKLVNGQNYGVSATGTGALLNVQADATGDTIDVSNLALAASITGTKVVGSANSDTITLGTRSTPDVVAGLGGDDTITIKNDGGVALDEVHFRSIDGTDTVTGLNLGSATPSSTNDFIAFLDNGSNANGSVDFAAVDNLPGPFGTRFMDGDTTSYSEFATLSALSAASDQSNKVIVINDSAAVITGFTKSGLIDAYIIVADDANAVSIFFDANWADADARTEVAQLVGVSIGQLDATDFGVYSTV